MKGNDSETDTLRYSIRHMFGIVHAVILTLVTFGLVSWFPSLTKFSFGLLGCLLLPALSAALTFFCNWCVEYVCDGTTDIASILKKCWLPPLGIFCASIILLPLEMMQSTGLGPLNMLIATSIFVNGIIVWLLQVYASSGPYSSSVEENSSVGSSPI